MWMSEQELGVGFQLCVCDDDVVICSLSHGGVHAYVDSFVECEQLNQFGRFSFNKFNKDVEVRR